MDKDKIPKQIGLRIKEIREEKEVTQQELAYRCNFEKSNMSRIENGKNNLTIGTLVKICNALKIKLVNILEIIDTDE